MSADFFVHLIFVAKIGGFHFIRHAHIPQYRILSIDPVELVNAAMARAATTIATAALAAAALAPTRAAAAPSGFLGVEGTSFSLDGKPIRLAGTNCY
jgi:mannan endo-1,4-beta-mannosidase